MLDIMRRKKRLKAILWLVIISLGLGMLLFFVPGTDMGGVVTNSDAATVDNYSISINDFVSTYRRTVEQLRKRGNERMDPETLKAMGVPRQVLDDLITSKILEIIADRFGVEVTPNQVRKAIEVLPYFQNQGKFIGIESYKALLAENGYTAAAFEEEMHRVQLMNKLREIITDSLEVSDREVRDEFSKLNQKTQVDYVILKQEDYKKRLKPTEAELRTYFDSHKEAYRTKEKRRAQYLQLPATQFLPSVKVTEEEILREWSQRSHEETTEAAHILFKVAEQAKDAEIKTKAEAVLKRIKNGEDFAALAKKYSEDTGSAVNGGYLGPFQRGQMVKEFENAAFSLKPGEISDLIRTQYGYHIIKTLKRETPTLDSNRGNLTMSIQIQKIQKLAKQKAEEAAALAQQTKDFNAAIKKLGIVAEIKETTLFTKDDNPAEFGISQPMQDEVFGLKELNSIGKAVEIPMGYAVPKLIEVQLPKPGEFAAARNPVEKDYVDFKSKELTQIEAKKLSEEAGKQGSMEKIAKGMGLTVKKSQEFTMSGTPDPEIGPNTPFNKVAFNLAVGGVSTPQPLLNNMVVLQVKSRSAFDEAAFQKEKAALQKQLLQSIQDPYFQDYVQRIKEELEKAGKIRINPKALEQF